MPLTDRLPRLFEVLRYYQAGLVNLGFGIGCYMALVWTGMNIFLAQAISHVAGTAFNYFTYSRFVFRTTKPAKLRFVLSYLGSYMLNLAALAACARFIANPYWAGIAAAFLVSIVMYFGLRRLVFRPAST